MDKRPEAMTDQDKLIALQMKVKEKSRIADIISIIFLLLIIFGFALATLIYPDSTFSEQENRYLQQKPKLSTDFDGSFIDRIKAGKFLDRLIDGRFTAEISDYFSDQFLFRNTFVGAKAVAEITLMKNENNNVTLGKDGYIVKRNDYPDSAILKKNIDSIIAFSGAMKDLEIPYILAMAGRNVDVLERYLPSLYPHEHSIKLWENFEELIARDDYLTYIDLKTPLKNIVDGDTGEQIYYKTDHHWTTLGAYYAYVEIMKAFKDEPQRLSDFTIVNASKEFYGTTWSSSGMKWIKPDTLQIFKYEDDDRYITEIADTGTLINGFYDLSYLSKKDKYSTFIGGNNARVDIYHSDGSDREKVLMLKDSFAHSVAPFLAYHYDLVILDPRYYKNSVKELVIEENIDYVLILNNIDSLVDTNVFGILNFRLSY